MAAHPSALPPLRIPIVGAGLCGLAAAALFRRQGHRVDIFKSSFMNKEIRAALTVQGNAIRVLEYLGYNPDSLKGVDVFGTVRFSASGGEGKSYPFLIPTEKMGRAGC
ncbi:hypothetical protein C8R45DRAFT_1218652 [Mycena sanguinolenta]|nr:hypothetical protein C8R45DRAFT_1218652 [Mycena sanguinolenta]